MSILYHTDIATPFGPMLAVGDDKALHLLEFKTRPDLHGQLAQLPAVSKPGQAKIFSLLREDLQAYFDGKAAVFRTPLRLDGTAYQQRAWAFLRQIPAGETRSYDDERQHIGGIARSVGQANKCNRLAVIVPCHRVCSKNGALGGYAGGIAVKAKLLEHERHYFA